MAKYYRDMFDEARKLCAELEVKLLEIEEIEAVLGPEDEVAEATGSTLSVDDCQTSQPGTSDSFRVVVKTSKNHPEGFEFIVPIDYTRPNCIGLCMKDYIRKMGIR
jgi:hypothetical protein